VKESTISARATSSAVSGPPVLIVGAGPTGLVTANLLGRYGVGALVVERRSGPSDLPRAVSIDDEAMRTLQAAALLERTAGVILPGTGTRYYGADGEVLAYARGPARPPLGHPIKNPLDQPEFEQLLLEGLERFPWVATQFSTELLHLEVGGDGATATLRGPDGDRKVQVRYVVGSDGGRSTVRSLLGVRMLGSSVPEPWIVVDTRNDPHHERYAMHHGDPRRPHVVVTGRPGYCRYEFLLLPGEDPTAATSFPFVRALVAPYRTLRPDDVRRCIVYQFHALVAERWRQGGVFLAGDAAHMMPPFAAQGLNTGIRDAFNLAWKLAAVIDGQAEEELLDTYERERRRHAAAMVRLSQRLGKIMMTTSPRVAAARDRAIRLACKLPWARRYLTEMRFRPPPRFTEGLVVADESDDTFVGRMVPQPDVITHDLRRMQLDDALGPGFALLAVELPADWRPRHSLWRRLEAKPVLLRLDDRFAPVVDGVEAVADADAMLTQVLRQYRGRVMVVRPDRYVAGAFFPEAEENAFADALSRLLGFSPVREHHRRPTSGDAHRGS
jgi:3-(3-hydroxy-phenyl)propionate hydroxylase